MNFSHQKDDQRANKRSELKFRILFYFFACVLSHLMFILLELLSANKRTLISQSKCLFKLYAVQRICVRFKKGYCILSDCAMLSESAQIKTTKKNKKIMSHLTKFLLPRHLPPPLSCLFCLHIWWEGLRCEKRNPGCAISKMRRGKGVVS